MIFISTLSKSNDNQKFLYWGKLYLSTVLKLDSIILGLWYISSTPS